MSFSNFDSLAGENGLNHYLESQLHNLQDNPTDHDTAANSIDNLIQVVLDHSGLLAQGQSKILEVLTFLKSAKKIKDLTKELNSSEAGQDLKKVILQATERFSNLKVSDFTLVKQFILPLKKIDEKLYNRTLADWLNKNVQGNVLKYISNKNELLALAPYLVAVKFDKNIAEHFLSEFLAKAKNLEDLSFVGINFNGTALGQLSNKNNLIRLEIVDCPNFNFTLPNGMQKLEILHVADCPKLDRRIPVDMKKLQHFVYPLCPSLNFRDLLVLLASLTSKEPSELPVCEDPNLARLMPSRECVGFFKDFVKLFPTCFDSILDYCIATKDMSVQYDIVAMATTKAIVNPDPSVKNIQNLLRHEHDLMKRLFLTTVWERITRNDREDSLEIFGSYLKFLSMTPKLSLVRNFCENFLKDPNCATLSPLYVNDALVEMDKKGVSTELIIDFLGYLRLAPSAEVQKEMLSNLQKLEELKLYGLFRDLFQEDEYTVAFLETPGAISGNQERDESTIVLTDMFINYQKLSRSNRSNEFDFEAFKKELRKPTARTFVDIYANFLLNDSDMKWIVFEIFPTDKQENKNFYKARGRIHGETLYLDILPDTPLKKPDSILSCFNETFERINVQFYGDHGIDEGGLGRQLLAQTVQGIMLGNSRHAKFERCDDGKWRPKAANSEKVSKSEKGVFASIGNLMGAALKWNYPLGQVFNDKFLRCIYSFKDSDFKQKFDINEKFNSLDHREFVEFITQNHEVEPTSFPLVRMILLSENPETSFDCAKELNAFWQDPALEEAIEKRDLDELRKVVRDLWASPFKSVFKISYTIADGIDEELGWDQLRDLSFDLFSLQLQGVISSEHIKGKLHFGPDTVDPQIRANMTDWFHEWLDAHEKEPEMLENLIQTITGARAVIAPITIRMIERNASGKKLKGIFIHSCSNEVDVPLHITKEGLHHSLDMYGRGEVLAFNKR